jgi:mono/diheme cytochrome c family protein
MVVGFFVVVALALGIFAVRSREGDAPPQIGRADPASAAQVAQGQQLYATRCAGCHGANLEGASAARLDGAGQARQHDDGWIFKTIKEGGQATAPPGSSSAMPAFGSLSDEQVWALIAYIKSTWQ